MKTRAIEMPLFIPTVSCTRKDNIRTMRVTLPAEPWGENPPNTEPERLAPPIRGECDWRKDSVLRRASLVKQ